MKGKIVSSYFPARHTRVFDSIPWQHVSITGMEPGGGKKFVVFMGMHSWLSVSRWHTAPNVRTGFGGWGDKAIAVNSAKSPYTSAAVIS